MASMSSSVMVARRGVYGESSVSLYTAEKGRTSSATPSSSLALTLGASEDVVGAELDHV
jgi:hypothetical protein